MESMPSIRVISTKALRSESFLFAQQHGWKLEVYPMIEAIFTYHREQIIEIIHNIQKTSPQPLLVFSSSNAIKALYTGCKENFLSFPAGAKACFVGEKTAAIASELLQTHNVLIANNALELIEKIDNVNVESFVFVSGQKRLDTIPEGLQAKGFQLKEFQLYNTIPKPVKIGGVYQAVLFFSPSAVESFFMKNSWESYRVAVGVGETTAGCLRSRQVEKIIIADKPGEIETMKALSSYIDEVKQMYGGINE
jgi:uroporphyrinogen-III synthase